VTVFLLVMVLFIWTFKQTNLEKSIVLKQTANQYFYRRDYDSSIKYWIQSALINPDQDHKNHIFYNAFMLAINTKKVAKANDILTLLLQQQATMSDVVEIINLYTQNIDHRYFTAAINKYLSKLNGNKKPMFLEQLDKSIRSVVSTDE